MYFNVPNSLYYTWKSWTMLLRFVGVMQRSNATSMKIGTGLRRFDSRVNDLPKKLWMRTRLHLHAYIIWWKYYYWFFYSHTNAEHKLSGQLFELLRKISALDRRLWRHLTLSDYSRHCSGGNFRRPQKFGIPHNFDNRLSVLWDSDNIK